MTDLFTLDRRYRAKRTAQCPAEYATAIQGFRRKSSKATRVAFALAAVLLLAALIGAR